MPLAFPKEPSANAAPPAGNPGATGFPRMPNAPPDPKRAQGESAQSEPARADAVKVETAKANGSGAANEGGAKGALAGQPMLQRLLMEVRRDLETTVQKEMRRVEEEFGSIVQSLSLQVQEARQEADRFKKESSALREANDMMEKKVRVLKELQEKLKDV